VSSLWQRLKRIAIPPGLPAGRRGLLRVAGLAIVAAFAALALQQVDAGKLWAALLSANPMFLLLAGAANVASQWTRAARWAAVVRPPGAQLRARHAFAPLVAGYAVAIVVPARAGDVVRSHMLARRTGLPTASVLAAALLDYVVGAVTLVPLLALLALAMPLPPWARHALLAFAAVGLGGFAAIWLLRPPPGHDPLAHHGARGLLARLRGGLGAAHDPRAIAAALAWGLVGWWTELLVALFALAALGLPATIAVGGLLVAATTAANVISLSPGNAGPFEVAAVLVLAGLGVEAEHALAFALLYHACHLAPTGLVGAAVLLRAARQARA
jgi:glycosyltransferase AglD